MISHFIAGWHQEAWKEAVHFLDSVDEDEREILCQQLEEKVVRLADTILLDRD